MYCFDMKFYLKSNMRDHELRIIFQDAKFPTIRAGTNETTVNPPPSVVISQ